MAACILLPRWEAKKPKFISLSPFPLHRQRRLHRSIRLRCPAADHVNASVASATTSPRFRITKSSGNEFVGCGSRRTYPFVDVNHLLPLISSSGPVSKHSFGGPCPFGDGSLREPRASADLFMHYARSPKGHKDHGS